MPRRPGSFSIRHPRDAVQLAAGDPAGAQHVLQRGADVTADHRGTVTGAASVRLDPMHADATQALQWIPSSQPLALGPGSSAAG